MGTAACSAESRVSPQTLQLELSSKLPSPRGAGEDVAVLPPSPGIPIHPNRPGSCLCVILPSILRADPADLSPSFTSHERQDAASHPLPLCWRRTFGTRGRTVCPGTEGPWGSPLPLSACSSSKAAAVAQVWGSAGATAAKGQRGRLAAVAPLELLSLTSM